MKTSGVRNALRKVRVKYCVLSVAVFAALLSIIFGIQGTLAWQSYMDSKNNQVEMKQFIFSQKIVENFTPPASSSSLRGGQVVTKESWVTNDGDIAAFVRMKVFPVLTSSNGMLHFEAQFGKQLYFENFGADWIDGGDGYYYYLRILPPGASTTPLFKKVRLDSNVVTYSNAVLTVTVLAETIETRKWQYRDAWWQGNITGGRTAIDMVLSNLATD